jgi:hypothetical protein
MMPKKLTSLGRAAELRILAAARPVAGVLLALAAPGCADLGRATPPPGRSPSTGVVQAGGVAAAPDDPATSPDLPYESFRAYGRLLAQAFWGRAGKDARPPGAPGFREHAQFDAYANRRAEQAKEEFFKNRDNRSRAGSPENAERRPTEPNIADPGPDLANFPNSAFTLPQGRAYVEISPFTYYGTAQSSPAQYNAGFLLRYGATDDIELRLLGNGVSWVGGSDSTWGFSPIAFDTKIQLWKEKPDYFLPAAGFEAYIQTQWLGSAAFNGGTQPSFTFNFDQSLPFDIGFEYNFGVTRVRDAANHNDWQFSFQWGLQRYLFNKDFAVFVHGFYNAMTLPRLANAQAVFGTRSNKFIQNAVGAGFVWTVSPRWSVFGQVSGGTTQLTPSLISLLGFAVAF